MSMTYKEIKNMSFEDAMKELESIVTTLETGEVALEKAIAVYQRGEVLRKFCEEKLANAKMKIEQVTNTSDEIKIIDMSEDV